MAPRFDLVPFEPAHVYALRIQAGQAMTAEELESSMASPFGDAMTALGDGRVIGCAGLVEVWPQRAAAWALLSPESGPWMLAITRAIRSKLGAAQFPRVEMAVDAGFAAGYRWAEMLGFVLETPEPLRKYLPGGRDAYLFARVK